MSPLVDRRPAARGSQEQILSNARIVTADAVINGHLCIREGTIVDLAPGASHLPGVLDLEGDYLLPGLVELHTDNLETCIAPRPAVQWPALRAVLAHDAQLAAAGITTVFDALSLGDITDSSTRREILVDAALGLRCAVERGLTRVEHRLHLRCEVSDPVLPRLLDIFSDHPLVGLVSVMDHTPGQRQFTDIEVYRNYYRTKYRLDDAELEARIAQQIENAERLAPGHRQQVVNYCRHKALPLASHDDATEAHVLEAAAGGAVISEFPTTQVAAGSAREHGLRVLMGAPNVVRGRSHSGNVSARTLAREGLLDILSSDYYPASLLDAVFELTRTCVDLPLPRAVALVSSSPAATVGLHDRGRIEPGLRADLVRVQEHDGVSVVKAVWCGGRRVH